MFNYRHNWGEYRVWFFDDAERLQSLPAIWTSVAPVDPFVSCAGGRAALHLIELCRLVALFQAIAPTPIPEER